MWHLYLFFCLFFIPFVHLSTSPSGSVELDDLSFDKITSKFEASLVKFDVAFPYGDKHDAFVALAKDAKEVDDLLIAEVGVKDYGEKENDALARKYGATKDNFPVVKLFIKGRQEPLTFDESKGFTTDELRRFVKENTGLNLKLPGCVTSLDLLAKKFMQSTSEVNRKKVLNEVEDTIPSLKEKDKPSGKIYKTIMEKLLTKGDSFIPTEKERVKKLLAGKISEEKKKEISLRTNILHSFILENKGEKEEL